jgi:hypothetical protein
MRYVKEGGMVRGSRGGGREGRRPRRVEPAAVPSSGGCALAAGNLVDRPRVRRALGLG